MDKESIINSIEQGDRLSDNLLIEASKRENVQFISYLIGKGYSKLNDALVMASRYKNVEVVKYLIDHGATAHEKALMASNCIEISNYLENFLDESALNRVKAFHDLERMVEKMATLNYDGDVLYGLKTIDTWIDCVRIGSRHNVLELMSSY